MTEPTPLSEKRHFHRIAHDAPAVLKSSHGEIPAKVVDVSLKGCLLDLPVNATTTANQENFTVEIVLSEEIRIVMDVLQIHCKGTRAGFYCRHIDLDSISVLRRLVELNLGNMSLLERDLEALTGQDRGEENSQGTF